MPSQDQMIRVVQLFEFYVRHLWPLHRLLVRGRIARRCVRCAASEKMLALEGSGLCVECGVPAAPAGTKVRDEGQSRALAELLRHHQGRGARGHDALALFSGGKDSTYMIHRIRSEHPGLRILAFTIDNGFMSPVAKQNVDDLVRRMDLDHLFVRPRPSFYKKLFRYCLTHLNEAGGYGTLDFSDGEFLLDTARGLAAQREIPLILCGYSRFQVEGGLGISQFESPREKELSDRSEVAGIPLPEIFSPVEQAEWWQGSKWPAQQVARLLFPLYAWDLEEAEIKEQCRAWGLLVRENQSPAVTNHQLIPLLGVVDVHQRGYSGFEPEFCRMIREGKARREDWQGTFEFLEYTSRTGLFIKAAILQSLESLSLTPADVGIEFR